MNDIINIPLSNVSKKCHVVSDCPIPVFCLKYVGTKHGDNYKPVPTITVTNNTKLEIKPFHFQKITFSVLVLSSRPATSIIYGTDLIVRLGLSCLITFVPTNDSPLYTIVYNNTPETLSFPSHSLQFYSKTTLTY
jgi:hypothetical protein